MWKKITGLLSVFFIVIFSAGLSQAVEQPAGLLLTWQQDPTTTMTIDWHTLPEDVADTTLYYREKGEEEWLEEPSLQMGFPYSDRTVHRVELTGLEPDTQYEFRTGEFTREYSFYTMPGEKNRPIRFVTGGDTHPSRDAMNKVAMEYNPDFIVWGGDLAYADGMESRLDRWHRWFENIRNSLITEEGRVVPVIAGIGNHEMKRDVGGNFYYQFDNYEDTDEWRAASAPYFMQLFAFTGQPGYNVLDFGDYLSLVVLDTDHLNPIENEQTDWLESVLSERQDVDDVFPVYHFPAYPSHRSYDEETSEKVRDNWLPLFEQYGIEVAFENHDHTYKRTYPILDGNIDNDGGIVYFGDGNWGRNPRDGDSQNEWYIDQFDNIRHGIVVTLTADDAEFVTVNESGEEFDYYATSFRDSIPSDTKLIYPENKQSDVELRPTFEWEASAKASSYELEISRASGFDRPELHVATISDITGTEYQLEEELTEGLIYFWRVRAKNFAGYSIWSSTRVFYTFPMDPTDIEDTNDIPNRVVLYPGYPNPFNPSTVIRFGLPEEGEVNLDVYNTAGQLVASLVNTRLNAGYHEVLFDASELSSGTYLYTLQTSDIKKTKTITYIK